MEVSEVYGFNWFELFYYIANYCPEILAHLVFIPAVGSKDLVLDGYLTNDDLSVKLLFQCSKVTSNCGDSVIVLISNHTTLEVEHIIV